MVVAINPVIVKLRTVGPNSFVTLVIVAFFFWNVSVKPVKKNKMELQMLINHEPIRAISLKKVGGSAE